MKLKDLLKKVERVAGGIVSVRSALWSPDYVANNAIEITWFSQEGKYSNGGCRQVNGKTALEAFTKFKAEYDKVAMEKQS